MPGGVGRSIHTCAGQHMCVHWPNPPRNGKEVPYYIVVKPLGQHGTYVRDFCQFNQGFWWSLVGTGHWAAGTSRH